MHATWHCTLSPAPHWHNICILVWSVCVCVISGIFLCWILFLECIVSVATESQKRNFVSAYCRNSACHLSTEYTSDAFHHNGFLFFFGFCPAANNFLVRTMFYFIEGILRSVSLNWSVVGCSNEQWMSCIGLRSSFLLCYKRIIHSEINAAQK